MKKKYSVIIQARLGSTRFPDKVIKKIGNKTILEVIISKLKKSKKISNIVLATTKNKIDDKLEFISKKNKIHCFRGSEDNVLERYFRLSLKFKSDFYVRITGDCPLIDIKIMEKLISKSEKNKYEYLSNTNPPTFPDGFDIEIFSKKILKDAYLKTKTRFDKEHVTPYMIRNCKKKYNLKNNTDLSQIRLTIDEEQDLFLIKKIINKLKKINITLNDIIKLINEDPRLFKINSNINRNEGSFLNKGQKLWKRAKYIIPGGNMLLSKRPEMYLPLKWPTYFSKAKGCYVWDIENKKYLDFSTMGVGTNLLGYANNKIDKEVIKVVKNSNMSSLNAPEEVYLAEKLVDMHPHFQMVRFAKTGGEANAIAVRIARSASKKDKIAICGYHGWHDWYLAANLKSKKNLNNHLLKNLKPNGVPKNLKNTILTFEYNNINSLKKIIKENKIGIIKMEVHRNEKPKNGFLEKVRNIATKNKIVLIFDECTSGFRSAFGGLHKKYKVYPDMCIFGKAIGNGYPITVIMGKKKIMEKAQDTFISSTFWTDRVGTAAALKTLNEMEKIKSWEKITKTGKIIKKKWAHLAKKYRLKINIYGLDAIPSFTINSKKWLKYKTYITQEMLLKNILASNLIFVSISHKNQELKRYFKTLENIFKNISSFEKNIDIDKFLNSPVSHDGFRRLN